MHKEIEITIVFNALNCVVKLYYVIYEVTSWSLTKRYGYPALPKSSSSHINKVASTIGDLFCLLGSGNNKFRYIILGTLINSPYALIDLHSLLFHKLIKIKVDDFLLFQILFLTVSRCLKMIAVFINLALIIYIPFVIPPDTSFFDYL